MPMTAKVFYVKNCATDPQPAPGPFDYECSYPAASDWAKGGEEIAALDEVYRQFNHVDGNEEISRKGYQARSLSVGDIVYLVEKKAWHVCDGVGWRRAPICFVQSYLKTISFKDSMMGLDWVLGHFPDLQALYVKGAKEIRRGN